jgi:hypothetical protein
MRKWCVVFHNNGGKEWKYKDMRQRSYHPHSHQQPMKLHSNVCSLPSWAQTCQQTGKENKPSKNISINITPKNSYLCFHKIQFKLTAQIHSISPYFIRAVRILKFRSIVHGKPSCCRRWSWWIIRECNVLESVIRLPGAAPRLSVSNIDTDEISNIINAILIYSVQLYPLIQLKNLLSVKNAWLSSVCIISNRAIVTGSVNDS